MEVSSMVREVYTSATAGADVEHVSATVSQETKMFRHQNGLMFDELSRTPEISGGMLAKIEMGSASLSIAIVYRIVAAFGGDVADVMNPARAPT
jgi:hypothetical protein